jgi:hypothetical protein
VNIALVRTYGIRSSITVFLKFGIVPKPQLQVHVFLKCILDDFSYFIGLEFHLLQM